MHLSLVAKRTDKCAMASCDGTSPVIASGPVDEKPSPFELCKAEGKRLLEVGRIRDALGCYEEAVKYKSDERLLRKIERMRGYLQNERDMGDSDMVEIGNGFSLHQGVAKRLFPYQKEGVLWMWGLHLKKKGGILGDDMGLGKTIQVIAFLSGMFESDLVRNVLLIVPVSLIANWKQEFRRWAPGIRVHEYHTGSKKEREKSLTAVQRRGGVLMTSYGMAQANNEPFCTQDGRKFVWCYLILDEGHKVKNQTKTTKAVCGIPAKNRLVLTGTAVQNNLRELWALFNFAHQGALVGSLSTFKRQYETPINRAREKDATAGERLLGTEIATQLRQLIQPYFLRRAKSEVKKENSEGEKAALRPELSLTSKKNDLVIWIYLSEVQKKIYREFLESEEVANILMTTRSPLVQLTVLKKICDHPRLLSKRACVQMGMHGGMTKEEVKRFLESEDGTSMSISGVTDNVLLEESGKMTFVLQLLTILRDEGHRTLFFSQSRKILDIIERILTNRHFRITRLDGTVRKLEERDQIVTTFQTKNRADVFLLTSQVGGVGLTLTSADRVIIYDPSWNPATDAQAVDRAYRIGQQKDVVVYRLITCSTVEEKIYRRQIFKDSIIKQTTGKQKDPMRYFSKQELRELFTLEDPGYSGTQVQLAKMHSQGGDTSPALDDHIAILKRKNIFGVSHHDRMFSQESKADAQCELVPGEIEHVKERAKMAQQLILAESDLVLDENIASATYTVAANITVKQRNPRSQDTNIVPILVSDDRDNGSSADEVVLIPDDSEDDDMCVVDFSSLDKSLANVNANSSEKSPSIIVENSDEELFPESEPDESIVIDSDEDYFSDALEERVDISKTEFQEPPRSSSEAKHPIHAPSALQEKDAAASNAMPDVPATPRKFPSKFDVRNASSPDGAFTGPSRLQSTLQCTPPKRVTPFSSPLHSAPASPFQATLSDSAELTPVKRDASTARSSWASASVHMVSSSSEGENNGSESDSDDDIVAVCRRDQHAEPGSSAVHASRTSNPAHLVSSSEGEEGGAEAGSDDDIVMVDWQDQEGVMDSGNDTP